MTFKQRDALMKPLSATEIEVLQELAERTTAQVIRNYTYKACQKALERTIEHI